MKLKKKYVEFAIIVLMTIILTLLLKMDIDVLIERIKNFFN